MPAFDPPSFRPHPIWRGGHLQTLAPNPIGKNRPGKTLRPTRIQVPVSDGDQIVLHLDQSDSWTPDQPTVLLIHGLTGCHGAPYMLRMAEYFVGCGYRVARMDMRGFGAAWSLARQLAHAGRSDDVIAAISHLADREPDATGPIFAVGISLGGGQLLRALGRIGAGVDNPPNAIERLVAIAAVSPPIDLARCCEQLQKRSLALYNYYFIRSLLRRAPKRVRQRDDYRRILETGGRPKTIHEFDQRITAPLSGFKSADDYYDQCSASRNLSDLGIPTLIVAAKDDPIVPFGCFEESAQQWSNSISLIAPSSGGHVGFVDRSENRWLGGRGWLDQTIEQFFTHQHPNRL